MRADKLAACRYVARQGEARGAKPRALCLFFRKVPMYRRPVRPYSPCCRANRYSSSGPVVPDDPFFLRVPAGRPIRESTIFCAWPELLVLAALTRFLLSL